MPSARAWCHPGGSRGCADAIPCRQSAPFPSPNPAWSGWVTSAAGTCVSPASGGPPAPGASATRSWAVATSDSRAFSWPWAFRARPRAAAALRSRACLSSVRSSSSSSSDSSASPAATRGGGSVADPSRLASCPASTSGPPQPLRDPRCCWAPRPRLRHRRPRPSPGLRRPPAIPGLRGPPGPLWRAPEVCGACRVDGWLPASDRDCRARRLAATGGSSSPVSAAAG